MFKFSPSAKGFFLEEINGTDIPNDAVEISNEQHSQIKKDLDRGCSVNYDYKNKKFVVVEPEPLSDKQIALYQIKELEAKQTPRRIREASLGIDNGWLADVDAKIAALREKL